MVHQTVSPAWDMSVQDQSRLGELERIQAQKKRPLSADEREEKQALLQRPIWNGMGQTQAQTAMNCAKIMGSGPA